jgi:hypothetical protein
MIKCFSLLILFLNLCPSGFETKDRETGNRQDSDETISSAATTRYNLLEATTESDSDSDLHEALAAWTQCSASRVSGAAKPDADASESNASDSDSLSTGTDTDAGSDDFEHESLPDSEPQQNAEAYTSVRGIKHLLPQVCSTCATFLE